MEATVDVDLETAGETMEGEHVVPGVTDNPKPPDQLSTWMDANPASQGGGWRPDMVC